MAGRNCTHNTQCYSGKCVDGSCRGRAAAETCVDSRDCDINMACITNKTAPYKSSCQVYLKEGEYCMSDLECPFDMVCWTLLDTDAALNPKER